MNSDKERSGELWVLRQGRRLGIGKNPLRRRSDRTEAVLLWCGVVAALLLIPVAAAVGASVSNSIDESIARQRAVLHVAKATTLEGTERVVPSAPPDVLSRVQVSYVDANGFAREGTTSVLIGTKAGDKVPVWLDRSGTIAPTPRSTADSSAFGISAGFLTLAGSWLLVWGVVRLARINLDRRRAREWENEWLAVGPRWLHGQK
ncbi:hypothetical protein AB0I34_43670 [Kribbella sp. NPDC050281]|uniref:Rv1733c family protein n=1 Tax=Kribbella sp. NPDC050281 TaxID=3155515 RepID=UPI0033F7149A